MMMGNKIVKPNEKKIEGKVLATWKGNECKLLKNSNFLSFFYKKNYVYLELLLTLVGNLLISFESH